MFFSESLAVLNVRNLDVLDLLPKKVDRSGLDRLQNRRLQGLLLVDYLERVDLSEDIQSATLNEGDHFIDNIALAHGSDLEHSFEGIIDAIGQVQIHGDKLIVRCFDFRFVDRDFVD